MKKLFILFALFSLIGFYSCEKANIDTPGQIQGMGNTPGDLKVKEPFLIPEGIHIIGEITGTSNPEANASDKNSIILSKSGYSCFGSGKFVKLRFTILNSKNFPRTVFFPKGLLWQCNGKKFQHCLQLQTTWVCLQANSSRTIEVDLYCTNYGVPGPDQTASYKILGVTSSKVIWDLLNVIGWRKVNYEMIYGNYLYGKGTDGVPTYEEITDKLQTIVWNLTNNGIALTATDKDFIESIPELAGSEIPQVDEKSQFPEYFDEFVVSGK